MLDRIKTWFGFGPLTDDQFEQKRQELLKKLPIPVFWLFGKTGSGKSSFIFLPDQRKQRLGTDSNHRLERRSNMIFLQ